jgi:putative ABC transport system permease protein
MLLHVLGALSGSTAAVLAYALLVVVRPRPTWDAQHLVALLGFVLGHALSGVSLGLSRVVEELSLGEAPAVAD